MSKNLEDMSSAADTEQQKVFAHRLKRLREDMDLTLDDLAKKLRENYGMGATYGSLGNYERCYRLPNLHVLSNLANFFDVSVDYLIGLTDVRNAKVIQTTVWDKEDKPHVVKIGIDKDSDLASRPFSEITGLVEKLKELGFDFNKNSK